MEARRKTVRRKQKSCRPTEETSLSCSFLPLGKEPEGQRWRGGAYAALLPTALSPVENARGLAGKSEQDHPPTSTQHRGQAGLEHCSLRLCGLSPGWGSRGKRTQPRIRCFSRTPVPTWRPGGPLFESHPLSSPQQGQHWENGEKVPKGMSLSGTSWAESTP